jgi:hypothetical protein
LQRKYRTDAKKLRRQRRNLHIKASVANWLLARMLTVEILRQLWLPFVAGRIVEGVQHQRLLTEECAFVH